MFNSDVTNYMRKAHVLMMLSLLSTVWSWKDGELRFTSCLVERKVGFDMFWWTTEPWTNQDQGGILDRKGPSLVLNLPQELRCLVLTSAHLPWFWAVDYQQLVGGVEHFFYFPTYLESSSKNWLSDLSEGFSQQPTRKNRLSIDYPYTNHVLKPPTS